MRQETDYTNGSDSSAVTTFVVPSRCIGKIIGRGGSRIKELQEQSKAKIQIRSSDAVGSDVPVDLGGDESARVTAKSLIMEIVSGDNQGSQRGAYDNSGSERSGGGGAWNEGGGSGFWRSGEGKSSSGFGGGGGGRSGGGGGGGFGGECTVVQVDSSNVGKIIGKGGSRIRELEEQSGAKVKVRKDEATYDKTPVHLIGSEECRQKAKELIDCVLKEDQSRSNRFSNFDGGDAMRGECTTIEVDNSQVGKIIGRGGSKIRELEEESGAKIKIRSSTNTTFEKTPVHLYGSEEARQKVEASIKDLLSRY